jgi:hypothetical protein
MQEPEVFQCPICKRDTPEEFREKHHLTPRAKKGKETVLVCCDCGDMLHQLFSVKELAKQYNTVEKILTSEKIQNWIEWISKRPDRFGFCMATKKRRT